MTSITLLKRINSALRRHSNTSPPPPPLPERPPPFQLFKLPPELLLLTLSYLPAPTLLNFRLVSKRLHEFLRLNETVLTSSVLSHAPTSQLLTLFPPPLDLRRASFKTLTFLTYHAQIPYRLAAHLGRVVCKEIQNRDMRKEAEREMVYALVPVLTVLHSQMRRDTQPGVLNDLELIRAIHAFVLVQDRIRIALGPRTATSRTLLAAVMRSRGLEEALMFFEADHPGASRDVRKRYMARMGGKLAVLEEEDVDWGVRARVELRKRRLGGGDGGHVMYYERWTWGEVEMRLSCEDCLDV